LGEHIKKVRLDKGLLQRDVAVRLTVAEDSITGWENDRYSPLLYHYPAIIAFLGYYPFLHETESIAGKLQQWRFCQGFTHLECGAYLKADPRNVRDWERKKKVLSLKRCQQITKLWAQLPQHLKTPKTLPNHETESTFRKSGILQYRS
jgi:DNA-binding XRE family transcriptional regulator